MKQNNFIALAKARSKNNRSAMLKLIMPFLSKEDGKSLENAIAKNSYHEFASAWNHIREKIVEKIRKRGHKATASESEMITEDFLDRFEHETLAGITPLIGGADLISAIERLFSLSPEPANPEPTTGEQQPESPDVSGSAQAVEPFVNLLSALMFHGIAKCHCCVVKIVNVESVYNCDNRLQLPVVEVKAVVITEGNITDAFTAKGTFGDACSEILSRVLARKNHK